MHVHTFVCGCVSARMCVLEYSSNWPGKEKEETPRKPSLPSVPRLSQQINRLTNTQSRNLQTGDGGPECLHGNKSTWYLDHWLTNVCLQSVCSTLGEGECQCVNKKPLISETLVGLQKTAHLLGIYAAIRCPAQG